MENRTITWDTVALRQFLVGIKYIARDSIQNAEKVHSEIINRIEDILSNPEMFQPDKYKRNNNGLYRAFELHHFRIAYYIAPDKIRILRVRHTSREPKPY
jgi:plasmid stabilization system protein ParE